MNLNSKKQAFLLLIIILVACVYIWPTVYYSFNRPSELEGVSLMTVIINDPSSKLEPRIMQRSLVSSEECWYNKVYNSVYTQDPGDGWMPQNIIEYFESKFYINSDYGKMIDMYYRTSPRPSLRSEMPNISFNGTSVEVICKEAKF